MSEERKDDDDDLGLDESLSSMRSMWREMRDEEPSDRGMAALMVAAREQAEAMKPKRSWWAVLLEQLRRPPVLAMATVVVLIGGAVVISRNGDVKTESEMAEPAGDEVADKAAVAQEEKQKQAPSGGEATRERWGADTGSAVAVAPADPAPTETKPVVTQRPPTKPTTTHAKPPRTAGSGRIPEGGVLQEHVAMTPEPPKEPAEEPKKEDAKPPMQLATGDDEFQAKGPESTSTAAPAPGQNKSVSRKPLPSIEGEDRATRDASIAQLLKQCEAAAAKNDCASVRTIAAKIARQDPATYKNRVLKNTNVARCLEPSPPAEASPINAD